MVKHQHTSDKSKSSRKRKTPLIRPILSMDLAGRSVLRFYFHRMLEHEQGVLNGWDVDEVHDMRVATRRLRTAFRVMEKTFGKKSLAPFLKQFRRLGQDLGAVRDLDVFIEFVDEYAATYGREEALGVIAFRAYLESEREAPRQVLTACLKRKRYGRFKDEFQEWVDGKTKSKVKKNGKRYAKNVVPELMDKCRDEVLAYEALLQHDPSTEALHDLRISCKKMRYTMEFFKSCYQKRLNHLIKHMVDLQDELGRLHDADVHVDYISGYISTLDRRSSRQRQVQADMEMLIDSELQIRKTCLSNFYVMWPNALEELREMNFSITAG